MAEGAIIFLLKVVYFSIERWCTFGLTNTMENHGSIKGWGSYLARTNEINAPTLVIHGTEDPIIPYEHGIHLSEVIPNAALVTLEGTGHELHHNDWDEIINVI